MANNLESLDHEVSFDHEVSKKDEVSHPTEAALLGHADKGEDIEDLIKIDFQQKDEALNTLKFADQEVQVSPNTWFVITQELGPAGVKEVLSHIKDKVALLETSSGVNKEATETNPGATKEAGARMGIEPTASVITKEAGQAVSVVTLEQEVAQIIQKLEQEKIVQQAPLSKSWQEDIKQAPHKESLLNWIKRNKEPLSDWIKQIADRIRPEFLTKVGIATVLSTIVLAIYGTPDSSSTDNSNEHHGLIRAFAAESQTPEMIVLRDQTQTSTQPQATEDKGNETDDLTRVPEPPATIETEGTEETFDLSATVTAYLKDQAEFPNNLSEEQHVAFVQEMENQRGAQPIYFEDPGAIWINAGAGFAARYPEIAGEILGQNEGVYRVAKDFFEKHPDIAKELTPTKYLPARVDKDTGNTQYLDNKINQWITIPNSAGENRPNIDKTSTPQAIEENWLEWPQTEPLGAKYDEYANLTSLQAVLSGWNSDQFQLTPVVLKNTELTKFPIYDTQLRTWWNKDFLQLLKVVKNHDGQPLYVVQFFATGMSGTAFYKEDSNAETRTDISETGVAGANGWERRGLYNNAQIWIAFNADQEHAWDFNLKASIINTKNTVPPSQCAADLLGDGKKQDNLLIELSSVTAPKQ